MLSSATPFSTPSSSSPLPESPPAAPLSATSARSAGLVYVDDTVPGIRRVRHGKGFRYRPDAGVASPDRAAIRRIRSLAIPPAWSDVWICPDPRGHLLATGRDARGRKQYRYHPRWRQLRDETKFGRMIAFGRALPKLRRRVSKDLALPGLPREKVIAVIVRLLERTLIRVGNEEYARANGAYGLTTLRDHHIEVGATRLRFRFRGKSGAHHDLELEDPRLARIVKRCRELPGQELFQYIGDDGHPRSIGSTDVNDYLRAAMGADFTAKDFRTWAGTALAIGELSRIDRKGGPTGRSGRHRCLIAAIDRVARRLGNTRSVCRNSYVHPGVIDAYLGGGLPASPLSGSRSRRGSLPPDPVVLDLLGRVAAARRAGTVVA